MKTIKLLFVLLAFSSGIFYSCSDADPIENQDTTQRSIALRTILNELKSANDITGKAEDPFCFEFVYPVTFSYNTGTTITAANIDGLLEILSNESTTLYLSGIEFPFDIMQQGAVTTIDSENELIALIEDCGFDTFNDDLQNTFCFDIVFPVMIMQNNQTVTLNTYEQFIAYLNNPANGNEMQIIFPISVLYNNETVVVNNLYDFYEMTNNCDTCVCSQDYAPVCVQTAGGILEYGNICYALCAGYTQNDLVLCNPSTECNINDLQITVGACNSDGSYLLALNFDYTNPGGTQFQVLDSANNVVGTYALSALPLTISNYPASSAPADYLVVKMVGNSNCTASNQWSVPNCACPCPTNVDPVCVQTPTGIFQYDNACLAECDGFTENDFIDCTPSYNFGTLLGDCFDMAYPVMIQYQGTIITANANGELLQYWFPNQSPMPAFVYPVTVTFGGNSYTFGSQAAFESQIGMSCN
ncbi:MAG TPA: hypothetical protein VGB50_07380 [Flavobacterium sp.]